MVLECGGNGRSYFAPQARGNQWTNGGAGCAEWTGVPLADVLRSAGVKASAVYTANYGTDVHLSGDPKLVTLSRGVPLRKAMDQNNLLVWAMNGKPLENIHGAPLRLVIPGWPGSASHKWLTKITLRDKVHDGPGMTGTVLSRRHQADAARRQGRRRQLQDPGVDAGAQHRHQSRQRHAARGRHQGGQAQGRGLGRRPRGQGRATCRSTSAPPGRQPTSPRRRTATTGGAGPTSVALPSDGYYEIWVRATDSANKAQPHIAGNWNPQGYGANPMHRIAVLVG